ncbi:MAG: helicase-related protein, partial [Firmicutes bacterium]|nr:helicase-related protein [Bacillota bacterium]
VHPPRAAEYQKVTQLSQIGRSTATTLTTIAAVLGQRVGEVDPQAAKVLSFTDNRQDASLQAGHFNDFIQISRIRSALYRALQRHGQLDHTRLTKAVLEAMDIAPEEYARDVSRTEGPGSVRARQALEKLVEYRLYEDLRRSWRVAQPNLEQAGLLVVDFEDWDAFAQDDAHWLGRWREIPAEQRAEWGRAILHHFRRELAIDAQVLSEEAQDDLRRQVEQELRWPWNLSERGTTLTQSAIFVDRVPDRNGRVVRERSYGARSILARYLRHASKWDGQRLDEEAYLELVEDLWQSLRGHYLAEVRASGHLKGWQLKASSLIWRLGSGNPAPPDPVRTRWTPSPRWEQETRQANRYFAQLYQGGATGFQKLEGREHTGQVPGHLRQEREEAFREGQLPVLFCSPTMELGIDISDLSVVHLRNVPPTPTNYAQRSGRAGRGGQAALVVTFAGARNPHDRYFFQRQREMVAGKVIPARFDLYNRDLIQAHIQAMWLAAVGLKVGDHMDEILDLDQHPELPLREEVARQMGLSPAARAALEEQAVHVLQPLLDLSAAPWLTSEWIRRVIEEAPGTFNQAFDRWRTLYRLAWKQRQEADAAVARPARGVSRAQRERNRQWARRQRDNAERELQLLRNEGPDAEESEFYPYRYLASEGFLPGYNFPRIPVRALVQVGGDLHVISRPGFIAVSEFGPHNRVYHEGRQHEVYRIELAAASDDSGSLFQAAKICTICGYWQSDLQADVCEQCGATFAQGGAEYLDRLLAMPTVRTREMWRITANEEDRFRHGYRLTVAYRQIPDTEHREGTVVDAEGKPLMEVRYLAHAELYRINRGWTRSREDGFTLDTAKGVWQKPRGEQAEETEEAELEAQPRWERGVQLYVKESRNLLLLHLPEPPRPDPREGDFVL